MHSYLQIEHAGAFAIGILFVAALVWLATWLERRDMGPSQDRTRRRG